MSCLSQLWALRRELPALGRGGKSALATVARLSATRGSLGSGHEGNSLVFYGGSATLASSPRSARPWHPYAQAQPHSTSASTAYRLDLLGPAHIKQLAGLGGVSTGAHRHQGALEGARETKRCPLQYPPRLTHTPWTASVRASIGSTSPRCVHRRNAVSQRSTTKCSSVQRIPDQTRPIQSGVHCTSLDSGLG